MHYTEKSYVGLYPPEPAEGSRKNNNNRCETLASENLAREGRPSMFPLVANQCETDTRYEVIELVRGRQPVLVSLVTSSCAHVKYSIIRYNPLHNSKPHVLFRHALGALVALVG